LGGEGPSCLLACLLAFDAPGSNSVFFRFDYCCRSFALYFFIHWFGFGYFIEVYVYITWFNIHALTHTSTHPHIHPHPPSGRRVQFRPHQRPPLAGAPAQAFTCSSRAPLPPTPRARCTNAQRARSAPRPIGLARNFAPRWIPPGKMNAIS